MSADADAVMTRDDPQAGAADLKVAVLAGGVGGAKMVDGLAQILAPENLTVIVNTGDDFGHLGLTVCPDLDTVLYNLAGVANPETGWGRADETWRTLAEVGRLGGPEWFRVGDLDLATHLIRSHILANGGSLTEATRHLARHFGVAINILPMSNDPAPTMILTDEGPLTFQEWFVARRWQPAVRLVRLPDDVRATHEVVQALENADVVIIAPSNPFVSIDPILNVYPIREMIADLPDLVAAVSPIVQGQALKGPAAKMMAGFGLEVSPRAVADYYGELLDLFVFDARDADMPGVAGRWTMQTQTIMTSVEDRRHLAEVIIATIMEIIAS
jgi:LPPG:FO 2-phospho-L-lactate transferase